MVAKFGTDDRRDLKLNWVGLKVFVILLPPECFRFESSNRVSGIINLGIPTTHIEFVQPLAVASAIS